MTDRRLETLAHLAALRSARSAARLAPRQGEVDTLRAQVRELQEARRPDQMDVVQAILQDRHDVWRTDRLRRLSMELALAEAAAQPLREAHARDRAREGVLARLRERAGHRGR